MNLVILEKPRTEGAWDTSRPARKAMDRFRVGSITTICETSAPLCARQGTAAAPELTTLFKMVQLSLGANRSSYDLVGLSRAAVQIIQPPEPAVRISEPVVRPFEGDDRVPSMLAEAKRITGWSWDRLAQALGCTRQALHGWMQGKPVAAVNAERLSRLHATLVFVDRGAAEETRALLENRTPGGGIVADLLETGHFDEVRRLLGQGVGRQDVSRWTRLADEAAREEVERKGHWFDRLAESDGIEAVLESPRKPVMRRVVVRRG